MVGSIFACMVILTLHFNILPLDATTSQNQRTCRNVSYNVQTINQVCCEQNSSQSVEVVELKSQMADLKIQVAEIKLQMAEIRAQKGDSDFGFPRDCQEIKSKNLGSGMYKIDPDGAYGVSPFRVRCNMTTTPAQIVIEHNYPTKTEVVNAGNYPNGNTYNIAYIGITETQQLVALTQRKLCWQFLRYDCYGSVISYSDKKMHAHWVDRNGNIMKYWPGGLGFGCACGVTKTCAGGTSQPCECEKNDAVWRFDEGNITDDLRLPVLKLYFSDTDGAGEMGHFTLGPLICQ